MHIQTHILSGWCIGNIFKLNARERFLCMIAAALPDLDGLGILINRDFYWNYHHVIAHGILWTLICSAALAYFSLNRVKTFFIYFLLLHLHILMDVFGSGECWGIHYLWPFSGFILETKYSWAFASWQNISAGCFFLFITILIIYLARRSPLEYIMPQLDKKIIKFFELLKLKLITTFRRTGNLQDI
ncbi:MAG: hypothetical protein A2017_05375 [Lentisphaerae bacterium GWF2_44_16]|nr:MAG: hypothetical protein A2017_05375 [Lentisphaerae bacterium GWF2_44_16]